MSKLMIVLAAVGLAVAVGSPAQAYVTVHYNVYYPSEPSDNAWGSITWYNRTAGVNGYVRDIDLGWDIYTTVRFRSFAGSTQIGSEFYRTAQDETYPYAFTMGDTNLVGGINKIEIRVCHYILGTPFCSTSNYFR